MKTLALASVCYPRTSAETRGLIQPPLLCRGGNPSTSVGGFYFDRFALLEAIQYKEVARSKEGNNLHNSNMANHFFFRKDYLL